MSLGESAGRTRGNPVRPAARRRMTEAERAQATHAKDDPQEWPDEVNTVQKISGRIMGAILVLVVATIGTVLIDRHDGVLEWLGVAMIMASGVGISRVLRWGTTRRL